MLDHFSHAGFQYEFRFESLRSDTWREQVERFRPHLLLVESAWGGESDSWRSRIANLDRCDPTLVDLVAWCRTNDIPTAFWSKEDPPNYLWFVTAARLFDHVFTVDAGSVERYVRDLGHERVGVLPFAAQPRLHHPIALPDERDRHDVAFAGMYYRQKYAERRRQMELLLDPARAFGLHIYARSQVGGEHRWPRKYRDHIVGTLPYEEMVATYKRYKVFLNVSSVTDSATMCPRRIFELLAAGTPVLSAPVAGVEALLGRGVVAFSESAAETAEVLARLLSDEDDRARRRVLGLRTVMEAHTYADRVTDLLDATIGHDRAPPRGVALVVHVPAGADLRRAGETVARLASLPAVEHVVVSGAAGHSLGPGFGGRGSVDHVDDVTGSAYARAVDMERASHLAVVGADHFYGEHFFADSLRAFDYTTGGAVGRGVYHRMSPGGPELVRAGHELCGSGPVHHHTIVMDRGTAARVGAPHDPAARDLPERCRASGVPIVSLDRFNFAEGLPGPPSADVAGMVAV